MYFKQIYLSCLAQASYLIGDEGKAVVVDPRRDVEIYLQEAERLGLKIEHVIATHVHADFVCGLRELAELCGAKVYLGRAFDGEHPCKKLGDGDELEIGQLRLRILETPGHTPESICILVEDKSNPEGAAKLLTGDTLFVGDVGRPDLVVGRGLSAEHMAGLLFDSLKQKITPLDNSTEIYPGHGAGSPCGKSMSSETSSTLGLQRLQNWALGEEDRERFIATLTEGRGKPPAYFANAVAINRRGASLRSELPTLEALSLAATLAEQRAGVQAIDLRSESRFGAGHLQGAINIGLAGRFASWCGAVIDAGSGIVLIADQREDAEEAQLQLWRIGIENITGFLPSRGIGKDLGLLQQVAVQELAAGLSEMQVIDVRRPSEFEAGRVPGALHSPLNDLPGNTEIGDGAIDRNKPTAVICGTGYRSSMACHFLAAKGFAELYNVAGGTQAWVAAGLGLERGA